METLTRFETRQLDEDLWHLLLHDHFAPKELGRLLGMEASLVCEAVFHGELAATVVNHHVVSIRRDDVIAWLRRRSSGGRPA